MTFISYAQNFEDVILWRALKHIDHGFYIDVGAAWPDEHSMTKAFYERGWCGINVEPNLVHYHQLNIKRPRDINLGIAISDECGSLKINIIDSTGLSTLSDDVAAAHADAGWSISIEAVEVLTLTDVYELHVPNGQEVHFLKVDVEGLEYQVIKGHQWGSYRPWIVLVEATMPTSQIESHQKWEPILLSAGYSLAYLDGINRFYVANERSELMHAFKYPPNVFDRFLLHGQHDAQITAQRAEALCSQYLMHIQAMTSSRSWRFTAPIRWTYNQVSLMRERGIHSRIRSLSKVFLDRLFLFINSNQKLKTTLRLILSRTGLMPILKRMYFRRQQLKVNGLAASKKLTNISPQSREIYLNLKAAIEMQRKTST